jgi:hypothetical protein
MNSSTTDSFRKKFATLPLEIQESARKAYRLWQANPGHPAIHFKKVGNYWSVRVSRSHRALGRTSGETTVWFWIGAHDEYQRRIHE